jgi:hypothetical protein
MAAKKLAQKAILKVCRGDRHIQFRSFNFPDSPLFSHVKIGLGEKVLKCIIKQYHVSNVEITSIVLICNTPEDWEMAWEMAAVGDNIDCRTWPEVIDFTPSIMW